MQHRNWKLLVLAVFVLALGVGCAGFTGTKHIGDITEGGESYGAWIAAHGDANGVDTKQHLLINKKTGKVEAHSLAADRGMTKIVVPAVIDSAGTVGAGLALGLTMPKQNNGGGSASVSVDNANVNLQKSNLTAIQKTTAIQQQSIKTGGPGGHGHGQGPR